MKYYCLIVALLLLTPVKEALSQVDSTRLTSFGCDRYTFPLPQIGPPYRADMDSATKNGYVYWDSLMRPEPNSVVDRIWTIQAVDTLMTLLRAFYAMNSYDPILFTIYSSAGGRINKSYWGAPAVLLSRLRDRACTIFGHASPAFLLFNSSCVLHIRVISVRADSDISIRRHHMPLRCIQAIILDTLKGRHILGVSTGSEGGSNNRDPSLINFYYGTGWTKDVFGCGMHDLIYGHNSYADHLLEKDSEYVVFLQTNYLGSDGHSAFVDNCTMTSYDPRGGVYPMHNGAIIDDANYFGLGERPTLDQIKARLRDIESTILQ